MMFTNRYQGFHFPQTKWKARWQHVPTHNRRVGGITIGIHPTISRYIIKEKVGKDQRETGEDGHAHN